MTIVMDTKISESSLLVIVFCDHYTEYVCCLDDCGNLVFLSLPLQSCSYSMLLLFAGGFPLFKRFFPGSRCIRVKRPFSDFW